MATRIESGQMQLRNVSAAPIQQLDVRPVQPIGFQVAAQSQSQMGQLIQRMSEGLFKEAGRLAEQEGLRYAAENPLTAEEIELAKSGVFTQPTGRVFDDAFRKARSLQLAAHFEAEGINDMMRLLPEIEAGRISSEQVIERLRQSNSGYTASLAGLDPSAAMKVNATLAASGNTIVRKALETEVKNAKEQSRIKFDMMSNNIGRLLEQSIEQSPEAAESLIDMHRVNTTRQALVLGDVGLQREYSQKFEVQQRQAKIAVLSKKLMSFDQAFKNELGTISALRQGIFAPDQRYNVILGSLAKEDSKSVEEVIKLFRAESSARYQKQQQDAAAEKEQRSIAATFLLKEYYTPGTLPSRKNQIVDLLVDTRVLSIEQMEKMLDPTQKPGDMTTFTALKAAIDNGDIGGFVDINMAAIRAGMNGEQVSQLYDRFAAKVASPENTEALRFIRASAGVPDVRSTFATKDNEHQIAKAEAIESRYNDLVTQYRKLNPGAAIPFRDLSRQAVDQYNATERADAKRQQAQDRLKATVKALVEEKKLPSTITIDANTNIDDLVTRYKTLRPGDVDEIKRLQDTLRGVSR